MSGGDIKNRFDQLSALIERTSSEGANGAARAVLEQLKGDFAALQQEVGALRSQGSSLSAENPHQGQDWQLFQINPQPMWIFDRHSLRFLAVNDAAVKHYGYSREEFLSMTILDIRPTEDVPRLVDFLGHLKEGVLGPSVWRHRRKWGDIIDVEISWHNTVFEGHDAVLVLAYDVTVHRQAQKSLWAREQQMRIITDAMPALISYIDSDERYRFVNKQYEVWFGRGQNEVVGRTMDEVLGERAMAVLRPHVAAALRGERVHFETETAYRNGGTRWIDAQYVPDRDVDGRVLGFFVLVLDITERKQAEAALRRSEERLRLGMKAGKTGTWDWDIRKNIVAWSDQLYAFHGLTREQFDGTVEAFAKLIHPDDAERVNAALNAALAGTSNVYELDFRTIRPDGEVRWLSTSGEVYFENGQPVRMLGATIDITERIRIAAALRASEERLQLATEGAGVGTWEIDLRTGEGHWSPRAAKLMMPDRHSVNANDWIEGVHPEDRQLAVDAWYAAVENNTPYAIEFRSSSAAEDGGIRWLLTRGHVERDATGTPIRGAGVIIDITARKRIEAALRESEARYRVALRGSGTVIFEQDLELRHTWIYDPRGGSVSNIVGKTDAEILGSDVAEPIVSFKQAVLKSGRGETREIRLEIDGKTRVYDVAVEPLRDVRERIVGLIGSATEITARKMTEESLRRATAQAEAASEAKDQFLAVLSHELRTPLTPVLGAVEMLAREGHLKGEQTELLHIIHRNVELETRLIDDLLDITRITRGKLELNLREVNLHKKIENVLGIVQAEVLERQLTLEVQLNATSIMLRADAARIQQILWNLIKNAVKFTAPGGTIGIGTSNVGQLVRIEVWDTGCGIDPQALPRIFQPFEQEGRHITREFGGLGLGLAICRWLVDMHGGTIKAESEGRDKGSRFVVELPLATAGTVDGNPATPSVSTNKPVNGQRILLIEDNLDTRRVMVRLLQASGYKVVSASTVADAVAILEKEVFDLIISDIGLPDGTGIEVLQRARTLRPVRAIAISGYGMEKDIARSKEAGFEVHLTKPVNLQLLEETVRRLTLA